MARDIRTVERASNCASRVNLAMRPSLREEFGENFDGDFAIQLGVGRAIDFAHPP